VFGLYWSKASAHGAIASMLSGLICYIALMWLKPDMAGIHPIVPTLVVNLVVFVTVSLAKPQALAEQS
jgi:sodium/pantothenate symporter